MNARTEEVLSALDASRDALMQAILRVPTSLSETAPAPGRWSAAQVVDHLAIVQARILSVMQTLLTAARTTGLGTETLSESAYGAIDWTRITNRQVTRVASGANAPAADARLASSLATFSQQRAVVRALFTDADGLALSTVIGPHPVIGEINLYQWALFVATHEMRHAAQVSEIADAFAHTVATPNDPARMLLRHTVATLAYRASKSVRQPPEKFGKFRASPKSRSAVEIVAHMGDLFDWALSMAKGQTVWHTSEPMKWKPEVARFFAALTAFDEYLASDAPLLGPAEQLFQGPIADALQHTGQLTLMRRLAGGAVRGESYAQADIRTGNTGVEQPASRVEFD
ncbi:MAG: DinB family protein [Gemmatimonas sp.]